MGRLKGKTTIDAYPPDRERVNDIAAALTAEGPGRFGQAEALRWLLNWREQVLAEIIADYTQEGQS